MASPFVALTRSESCAIAAFKHMTSWDDFLQGTDSDMRRMHQRFTEMLDRLHTEAIRKHSQVKTADE